MADLYVDTDIAVPGDGTSWGAAKATLSAALALIPDPLVDNYVIHCKGTVADATAVSFGRTAGAYTVTVQCDSADRHHGIWSTAHYRLVVAASHVFVTTYPMSIVGLQIGYATGYRALSVNTSAGTTLVDKCIIKPSGTINTESYAIYSATSSFVTVRNTIAYGNTTEASGAITQSGSGTMNCYNVTVYNCGYGFWGPSGTLNCYNCGAAACSAAGYLSVDVWGTNCSVVTPSFVSVVAGSENLHLSPSDTAWKGLGTDYSGSYTDDIDGEPRVLPWDIGADDTGAYSDSWHPAFGDNYMWE